MQQVKEPKEARQTVNRVFNFSAGPATLPLEALEQAQAELLDYQGSGMSIMEASHRGKEYDAVHQEAIANIRRLLGLTDAYAVLLLHGGATTQFAMVPMNFLGNGQVADYVNSGSWASKAIKEAQAIGKVHIAADTSKDRPARIPAGSELDLTPGAAYVHITSNETIAGTQWATFPKTEAPLVADMSSEILSRPIDATAFGLIYAGAQKNLGPAGVALVVMRKDLVQRASGAVPVLFRYATHIDNNSLYNTPPCFAIYMVMLVTRWLLRQGGVEGIAKHNREKAAELYAAIDATSFYTGTAAKEHRSAMNVTFRAPSEELEGKFLKEAAAQGLVGLKGHRSVGGLRASIYNAFPSEGVTALVSFMKEFERKNG